MDAERWQKIQELFAAASELEKEDRPRFLKDACGPDVTLRTEVESLIVASERAEGFIEAAIANAVVEGAPARIGPYRIERELGHGGMGAVYLAVRDDDEYKKQVAIKLVRGGPNSAELVSRFRNERQILANLDHPNTARLLDGGTTETGLPYVVMEYVDGEAIDVYCDRQRLSTEERLKLFRTICSAVHHAHQHLIVHRDLKPSNILVTPAGTPKLLDFGIAKLLDHEQMAPATRTAVRIMTPEYASPEQVRGLRITTASDVYSLGVVLYELLTGQRPYQLKGRLTHEIERAICEQEPERPSTAITRKIATETEAKTPETLSALRGSTTQKLRRQLAGDIDNIVLTALRKEPERRYSSAEQLSEDIRRHLEGLPVLARGDALAYRANKFVKRHRVGVAAAAVVVVLFVSLIGFYTIQLRNERDRARAEALKAQRVSEFLTELFQVSDPSQARGQTIAARDLLDRSAERIEKDLTSQPDIQATMMAVMGKAYQGLGLYDEATPLLEKALQIRRSVYGDSHFEVAQSLNQLGSLLIGKGRYDSAEPLFRQALEILQGSGRNQTEEAAESLNNLGQVLQYRGQYDEAETLYRQSLSINRSVFGEEHREVATNLSNLATLLQARGDLASAEPLTRQALEMRRKILGEDHPDLQFSLNNLAVLLHSKREYDEAETLYRQALEMRRRLYGDMHPYVANNMSNLAVLLYDKGVLDTAEQMFRRSLELHRQTLPASHPDLARPLLGLGDLLMDKGQAREAEALLREGVEIRRNAMPTGHWRIAQAENALGACLLELRKFEEAEGLLTASYARISDRLAISDNRRQKALTRIIKLYESLNQTAKAMEYREQLASAAQ